MFLQKSWEGIHTCTEFKHFSGCHTLFSFSSHLTQNPLCDTVHLSSMVKICSILSLLNDLFDLIWHVETVSFARNTKGWAVVCPCTHQSILSRSLQPLKFAFVCYPIILHWMYISVISFMVNCPHTHIIKMMVFYLKKKLHAADKYCVLCACKFLYRPYTSWVYTF